MVQLAELVDDAGHVLLAIGRKLREDLPRGLHLFFGRCLGRDQHVVVRRLPLVYDDRRLLECVPCHSLATLVDEIGKILARGGTQLESALLVNHGTRLGRNDSKTRRGSLVRTARS